MELEFAKYDQMEMIRKFSLRYDKDLICRTYGMEFGTSIFGSLTMQYGSSIGICV